jgi:transcriptional regulator with XRE-family HTH domain
MKRAEIERDEAIRGRRGVAGFPERLKCAREMRHETQDSLGKKANITAMHICHFECGRRLPNAANLRALSIALDTSLDYLLDCNL